MDKQDYSTVGKQDKEQERLAKTWDAAYKLYVKFPNENHYQLMCNAYSEMMRAGVQNG